MTLAEGCLERAADECVGDVSSTKARHRLCADSSAKYKLLWRRRLAPSVQRLPAGAGCPDLQRLWHFQMVHHDIWDYDDANRSEAADGSARRQAGLYRPRK